MRFDAPANLWFASLIGVILLLYILKARRKAVTVPSTLLWERLIQDVQATTPWQRLRNNILMYLQILGVALLAIALARPSLLQGSVLGRSTVIILDGSASMRATDVAPTRWDAASKRAGEIVFAMGRADSLAVILMEDVPRPVVPFTSDKSEAVNRIGGLRPGYGSASLEPALSLAATMLSGKPSPRIILISDGAGLEAGGKQASLPPGIHFEHLMVGGAAENLSVASLGARPWGEALSLLARVKNHGQQKAEATLEIFAGEQLIHSQRISVEPGKVADTTVSGVSQAPYMLARITSAHDFLPDDDSYYLVQSGSDELSALLVTKGNTFLQRALSLRSGVTVYTATPEQYAPSPEYGLYVFDGFVPEKMPDAPSLVFDPSTPVLGVTPKERVEAGALVVTGADHPVMKYVDVQDVSILASRVLSADSNATTLATRGNGAVVSAVEGKKVRALVVGFDVHQSDWPLRPSFPMFVVNAVNWLVPQRVEEGRHIAGRAVRLLPPAWAEHVSVIDQNGKEWDAGELFTPSRPGLYALGISGKDAAETRYFWAETDRSESDLKSSLVSIQSSSRTGGIAVGRPLWFEMGFLALALLTLEWWLYNRGV